MDRYLSVHSKLLDINHHPDMSKNYTMLELTINYLLQYSNCKIELKKKLKGLIEPRSNLLLRYCDKHAFSSDPIAKLF